MEVLVKALKREGKRILNIPEKAMLPLTHEEQEAQKRREYVIYVRIHLKETLKNEVNGKLKIIVIIGTVSWCST